MSTRINSMVDLQRTILLGLRDDDLPQLDTWLSMLNGMRRDTSVHVDPQASTVAWTVANNVKQLSAGMLNLQDSFDKSLNELSQHVERLFIEGAKKRTLDSPSTPSTPLRTSKRPRAPSLSSPRTPIPLAPSPTPSEASTPPKKEKDSKEKEPDHSVVRLWFLNHLSRPYPTLSQKETLATKAGITRNKVDSDLTNFRRRAGWTDLMNRFCGGDRDKMKRLVERVENGKETREEVLKSVQRMKDYLGRREEKRVGDWIREVTALTSLLTSTTGSTTTFTSSSTDSASTISHHRSSTSLSSLSQASNILNPTPRSLSGSSASSSSLSDTSFTLQPAQNRKRLNPNAEVFVPNKRYAASTSSRQSSTGSASEVEARWVNSYDPSIWSTTTSIPLLPHISASASAHNTWSIPREGGFQPRIVSWDSNGSVSGVSGQL
ncbi:hypothetical protein I302_106451 [Kwoniella bestiolae CBS 10118]|uniref:KN homeodomain domain-containing protein n=1 Tax=Kwoniella bestiolae CBS 10118 TaxID=1296100 RepID=A0A1B9G1E5_9TREE|nr:hypothetical protein I302_06292 [Kwoniella bestiolae CBS 10118]OCF24831.1 hypothetical protein I302_06292 [Kwoniella bestiolae CBS 10118]